MLFEDVVPDRSQPSDSVDMSDQPHPSKTFAKSVLIIVVMVQTMSQYKSVPQPRQSAGIATFSATYPLSNPTESSRAMYALYCNQILYKQLDD